MVLKRRGSVKCRSGCFAMHDSTDTEHIMIATGYSEVIISFNFISRTKPGGSASRFDLRVKC